MSTTATLFNVEGSRLTSLLRQRVRTPVTLRRIDSLFARRGATSDGIFPGQAANPAI